MVLPLNRIAVILLMLLSLLALSISVITLSLTTLLGFSSLDGPELDSIDPDLMISLSEPSSISSSDSPYFTNASISSPALSDGDLLFVEVYGNGKLLAEIDCLEEAGLYEDYIGRSRIDCPIYLPYDYSPSQSYSLYPVLYRIGSESTTHEPAHIGISWQDYESSFWGFSSILALLVAGAYLIVLVPVGGLVMRTALSSRHRSSYEGEYTEASLANPLHGAKTLLQKTNAFLISPYFWSIQAIGILFILLYMAISSEIWSSPTALMAFALSGLIAFIIPCLWCALVWYLDSREREPLRIIATLFLWGMLSALMAIGFNTIFGVLFSLAGLGFLLSFLIAPPVEELFKGSGLALLSEHHEYDSVEDGILFGFVIGMGFSFIENWIYLIDTPMGSDILGWLVLVFMRTLLFSANHGFYTAIIGGAVGFLKERGHPLPTAGLLVGVPVAAFFHAMHNSGEMLTALLGGAGLLIYCCLLIPVFDYLGLMVLGLLFLRMVLRQGRLRPA